MLGQISALLAGEKVSIVNLMNKSRGEWTYIMIDAEVAVGAETLNKIGGMIKVRMLMLGNCFASRIQKSGAVT